MNAEGPSPTRRPWLLVLTYLGIFGLIPLLFARDREVRWHARNGLLLFAAVAATGAGATLVGVLAPSLSCLYAVAMLIVSLVYVFIVVLATVKALEGQRLMIPGISSYASRLAGSE